jgi:hypothetical protein
MWMDRTNRHDDRLMVSGGSHAATAVATSSQAALDSGRKEALSIALVVDTFEEGEFLRVRRIVAIDDLASDVGMANNIATLKGLGSGVVCGVRISESAGGEVVDLNGDVESLVSLNVVTVGGILERSSNHIAGAGDFAHD